QWDMRIARLPIDVESHAEVLRDSIADTAAVRADDVDAVRCRYVGADPIAIVEPREAGAHGDVEGTVDLLLHLVDEAGLEVVRLIDIVGVLHVARPSHGELRRIEGDITDVGRDC